MYNGRFESLYRLTVKLIVPFAWQDGSWRKRLCQYLLDCSVVTFCCAEDMIQRHANTNTVHAFMSCARNIQTRLASERGPAPSKGRIMTFYMQTFPPPPLRPVVGENGLFRKGPGNQLIKPTLHALEYIYNRDIKNLLLHVSVPHRCHHQGVLTVVKVVLSKWPFVCISHTLAKD
jgi:hypothetical protein